MAKITVEIFQGDICSDKIFIGFYLEFKLNLANTQGRIKVWPDVTVNNLTTTINLKNCICFSANHIRPPITLCHFGQRETKTVEIQWKSNETHRFEMEQSKFYKPNSGDFEVVYSWNLYKMFNDLHWVCNVLPRQISTKFKSIWLFTAIIIRKSSSAFWHWLKLVEF